MRGHGSGRIVRRAHVEETGVRCGRDHCFDIVPEGFCQRSLDDARSGEFRGFHSGFIAGVRGDVALGRRSERQHGEMQRLARAGKNAQVFRLQTLISVNVFTNSSFSQ